MKRFVLIINFPIAPRRSEISDYMYIFYFYQQNGILKPGVSIVAR